MGKSTIDRVDKSPINLDTFEASAAPMAIAMIFRVSRSSFSTTSVAETSVICPKLKAGSVSFSMFQICFKQGAVDPSFLFSFTQIVYYVDTSLHLTVDVTTRHARKLYGLKYSESPIQNAPVPFDLFNHSSKHSCKN